jgi:AraC-like DNA-binding protein/quercetin dioxygenase-like cupin family protein
MNNEFEIIQTGNIKHINMLFNKIKYRSPHMHREFELVYNLGGDCIYHVGASSVRFKPGTFAIFNPNQVHEIVSMSPNPFMVCLQIAPEFFENVDSNISFLEFDAFYLPFYENSKLSDLVLKLSYAYLGQEKNYNFECAAFVYQIFKELLDAFPHHITTLSEKKNNEEKALRLKRILKYAKEHYMEKISLQDLANKENLSATYLSRFIKENLNRSFQEYIGELRYNQAKYLIKHTDKNLMEICEECGYSDYRYFYQVFMEKNNCSPKQYRGLMVTNAPTPSGDSVETKLTRNEALEILKSISHKG